MSQRLRKSGLGQCIRVVTGLSVFTAAIAMAENLDDIYQLALQNDPTYQAGIHQFDAGGELYYQARASLLPSVTFFSSRTETEQDIVSSDNVLYTGASNKFPVTDYTLSIKQSLYSYSNWARLRQSEARTEQFDAEYVALQQDLMQRVAERYFAVLAVLEDAEHIKAEKLAVNDLYELVEAKRRDGLARETDMLDAQARSLQVKSREIEIQSRLRDALQFLSEMTGSVPIKMALLGQDFTVKRPDPMNQDEWLTTALEHNPELKIRDQAVEAAREEVKVQKGGHYPTFDLELRHNDRDTQGTPLGGGSRVKSNDIVFSLNLPIYSGGLTSSRVRETTSQLSKSMQEQELERRAVKRKTFAAYDGVLTDIAKLEALKMSVESYELAAEAKRLGYASGLNTALSILDAESDLFQARSEYARARYGYILNTLRLKRSVGVLTADDLSQINKMLGAQQILSRLTTTDDWPLAMTNN